MRAAETRARAEEIKEIEPKAIMLRIAKGLPSGPKRTQCLGGTRNGL